MKAARYSRPKGATGFFVASASWERWRNRRRAAEAQTLGTLIAQAPGQGGKVLSPEGSRTHEEREGKKALPGPETLERGRLESIAKWELQVKARPLYDAARLLAEQASQSATHKPERRCRPPSGACLNGLW